MALFQERIDQVTDQLESLSPRDRMLVSVMVLAGILLIGYIFSLVINNSLSNIEADNRDLKIKLQEINQLQGRFEQARKKVQAIEKRVAANRVDLGRYLDELSSRFQLKIDTMTPTTVERMGPQKKKRRIKEDSVKIELKGASIASLARFLDAIENSGKIVKVRKLRLSPNFSKPEDVDMTATISTYSIR